jgi:hypothetical protein
MEGMTMDKTSTYTLRMLDGSGAETTIQAESDEMAKEAARDWAREGDYDLDSTIWISARVLDADGDDVADVTVSIDPVPPKCSDSSREGHDWQSPFSIVGGLESNPGVWGHGGGVIINEVCMRCGCARTTDTWAQDRATGKQGLTSISYDAQKYSDQR